jgi:hypothetical protein
MLPQAKSCCHWLCLGIEPQESWIGRCRGEHTTHCSDEHAMLTSLLGGDTRAVRQQHALADGLGAVGEDPQCPAERLCGGHTAPMG